MLVSYQVSYWHNPWQETVCQILCSEFPPVIILTGNCEQLSFYGCRPVKQIKVIYHFFILAERPSLESLARIRSNLLLFVKPLILQQYQLSPSMTGNNFTSNGEEVDSLFNFLSTVQEVVFIQKALKFLIPKQLAKRKWYVSSDMGFLAVYNWSQFLILWLKKWMRPF